MQLSIHRQSVVYGKDRMRANKLRMTPARFLPAYVSEDSRRAVFLPAAGYRNGTSVNNAGSNGNYWSSTANDSNNAYNVNFNSGNLNPQNNNNRNNGLSVRLVRVVQN